MRSEENFIMVMQGHDKLCSFIKTYVLQYPRLPLLCLNLRSSILVSQPIQTHSKKAILTFSPSIHAQPPTVPVQAYPHLERGHQSEPAEFVCSPRLNADTGCMSWSRTTSDSQEEKSRGGANREGTRGGLPT